jgi:hypothetical protein
LNQVELGRLVAARYGLDASAVPIIDGRESRAGSSALVRLDVTRAQTLLRTRLRRERYLAAYLRRS